VHDYLLGALAAVLTVPMYVAGLLRQRSQSTRRRVLLVALGFAYAPVVLYWEIGVIMEKSNEQLSRGGVAMVCTFAILLPLCHVLMRAGGKQ